MSDDRIRALNAVAVLSAMRGRESLTLREIARRAHAPLTEVETFVNQLTQEGLADPVGNQFVLVI